MDLEDHPFSYDAAMDLRHRPRRANLKHTELSNVLLKDKEFLIGLAVIIEGLDYDYNSKGSPQQ